MKEQNGSVAALQRMAGELIDAAEPVTGQSSDEAEEYVVPVECIEDLRGALLAIKVDSTENLTVGPSLLEQFWLASDAYRAQLFLKVCHLLADARLINDAAAKAMEERQTLIHRQNAIIVDLKLAVQDLDLQLKQVRSINCTEVEQCGKYQ